uniref:Uncharacterized protein n=1 Tax=Anopheles farauti TaxID=69004 RepID=A0A182QQL6_9DIPT
MVRRLGSNSSPSLMSDLYAWMPIAVLIFIAASIIGSRHFRLRSSSDWPTVSTCGEDAGVPTVAGPPLVMPLNRTDMRFSLRLVACSSLRVTSYFERTSASCRWQLCRSAVRRAESGFSSTGATVDIFPPIGRGIAGAGSSGGGGGGGGSKSVPGCFISGTFASSSQSFCSIFGANFSGLFGASVDDGITGAWMMLETLKFPHLRSPRLDDK